MYDRKRVASIVFYGASAFEIIQAYIESQERHFRVFGRFHFGDFLGEDVLFLSSAILIFKKKVPVRQVSDARTSNDSFTVDKSRILVLTFGNGWQTHALCDLCTFEYLQMSHISVWKIHIRVFSSKRLTRSIRHGGADMIGNEWLAQCFMECKRI